MQSASQSYSYMYHVTLESFRAELNNHAARGIEGSLKILRGGDVAAKVELHCDLVKNPSLFDILEKINFIIQGRPA